MYLLFDADNTLFDFDKNNHRAFQRTCQRNGLPFSEEKRRGDGGNQYEGRTGR